MNNFLSFFEIRRMIQIVCIMIFISKKRIMIHES